MQINIEQLAFFRLVADFLMHFKILICLFKKFQAREGKGCDEKCTLAMNHRQPDWAVLIDVCLVIVCLPKALVYCQFDYNYKNIEGFIDILIEDFLQAQSTMSGDIGAHYKRKAIIISLSFCLSSFFSTDVFGLYTAMDISTVYIHGDD